ncbi:MAG: hypothetical protein KJO69_05000 [Gammaproteobacteria bacterium]|nr:hypothetical protein [Gammaproteobacteria bacterium]
MSTTHFSGPVSSTAGFQAGSGSVEAITAGKTLTAADNGKTFILSDAASGDITLPAVASSAGFKIKVICGFAITSASAVISAEGDNIEGALMVASTVVDVNAADQLNFIQTAENIGDWVTVESDGTYWYADGRALTTGAITATG